MRALARFLRDVVRGAAVAIFALILVTIILVGSFKLNADYQATQGTGTAFSSVVINSVHYMANLLCDSVVGETQCMAVKPASTPAANADPAAVVTLSPNTVGLTVPVSNASSALISTSTNLPAIAYLYGYNGTTWDQLQVDGSKNLRVTQAGSANNSSSGVATSSTNAQSVTWLYGFNGTTWDQLQVDGSKNLKVTQAGSQSNASSGVATSSTNAATVGWMYGFNGTTWDQLQVDGSKNLKVAITANTSISIDPCAAVAKTSVPISQTSNTKIFSATSAKKNYICSFLIVGADAEDWSIVEGTGSTCGTNTAAILGGTTATNGPNFAANSGAAQGNGAASIATGFTTNSDVCLFQSGSGRVAGVLTYVQQ